MEDLVKLKKIKQKNLFLEIKNELNILSLNQLKKF